MGVASINVSALEQLIDSVSLVGGVLSSLAVDVDQAIANTQPYPYFVTYTSHTDAGPRGYPPAIDDSYTVERTYFPGSVISPLPSGVWDDWVSTWSPFLHRALGLAYELLSPEGGFGSGGTVPLGVDMDARIAAAVPALTPAEVPVVGANIGAKVAEGGSLTGDEWLYWQRYGGDRGFANALMGNCTVEQLADLAQTMTPAFGDPVLGLDVNGLTAGQQAEVGAADLRLQAMGDTLAAWSGVQGNQDGAVATITGVLKDFNQPLRQFGLTVLLGYGQYASPVAVGVADSMYEWNTAGNATTIDFGSASSIRSGTYDTMTGVMGMLGNDPAAATQFFGDMSSTVPVGLILTGQQGDPSVGVDVSARVKWAVDYSWCDGGLAVGRALGNAGSPTPGQALTSEQAQVGSQVLDYVASLKQVDHGYQPQDGISRGVATIIASNMASLFQVTPRDVSGETDASFIPPAGVSAFGWLGPDGTQMLGVDATVFGTAIQAISPDEKSVNLILDGWAHYMPTYLNQNISTNPTEITQYLSDKDGFTTSTTGGRTVNVAAGSLAFIVDNSLKGENIDGDPDYSRADGMMKIAQAGVDLAVGYAAPPVGVALTIGETAYDLLNARAQYAALVAAFQSSVDHENQAITLDQTLVNTYWQTLADKGYYDQSVQPVYGEAGKLDMSSPDTQNWLTKVYQQNAVNFIQDSEPGNVISGHFIINLPPEPPK